MDPNPPRGDAHAKTERTDQEGIAFAQAHRRRRGGRPPLVGRRPSSQQRGPGPTVRCRPTVASLPHLGTVGRHRRFSQNVTRIDQYNSGFTPRCHRSSLRHRTSRPRCRTRKRIDESRPPRDPKHRLAQPASYSSTTRACCHPGQAVAPPGTLPSALSVPTRRIGPGACYLY